MGTYPMAALPRKLEAAAKSLPASEARLVSAGGKKVEQTITAAYRARTGDGRLSGTKSKRRPVPAPVFAKMKDVQRHRGNYVALIVPQGAWGLLEQPIEPHFIDARQATTRGRKGARTRGARAASKRGGNFALAGIFAANAAEAKYLASRSQALKLPGDQFAAVVRHPGIDNPRRVFHPTALAVGPAITSAMADEAGKIIRSAYRGAR